jgi:hypothetical protein
MKLESRGFTGSVPPLPLWERSDCIARCNPGEGLQSIDRPEPLTPTLQERASLVSAHKGRGGSPSLLRHLDNTSTEKNQGRSRISETEWNP